MSSPKFSIAILITGGPLEDSENYEKFGKTYYGMFNLLGFLKYINLIILKKQKQPIY